MKLALIDDNGTVIIIAESISYDTFIDAKYNGVLAKILLEDVCTKQRLKAYLFEKG